MKFLTTIAIADNIHEVRCINVDHIVYIKEYFKVSGEFIHSEINTVLTVAYDSRRLIDILSAIYSMPDL